MVGALELEFKEIKNILKTKEIKALIINRQNDIVNRREHIINLKVYKEDLKNCMVSKEEYESELSRLHNEFKDLITLKAYIRTI